MRRSKVLFFVVSLLLVSASAQAAEFFVSLSGNDANPGTSTAPFRTIKAASRIAQPGDVVTVRGGVYPEATSISTKGTAAAPITFRAKSGETVVLDGSSIPAGTPVFAFNTAEYIDFTGFEIRNSSSIGITVWHARNIRIVGNHVHHTTRNGIYAGGETASANTDITISGNTVHDTVLENQYHQMTAGGWAGAVVVSRTDRATITGNRIYNNDGEGLISLRSNYAVIRDNEISDNFSAYLYLDNARFATVDRNLIYSTGNTRYYRDGRPGAGIAVANETKDVMNPSSDNVFTNNIVIGTRWGFYYGNFESGGGLKNTKVLNNTFYGTTEALIKIDTDAHANSVVQNNIFYGSGSPAPTSSGAGQGVTYGNNLWYGVTSGAAAGSGDVYGDPMLVRAGGRAADDYRIAAGSAAVAKALNVSGIVATDYFGKARVTPFDVGAHQLSSGAIADSIAPSIPANLRPTSGSETTITLAWDAATDNVGVTGYVVFRNAAQVATVSTTTWTDPAVAEGTLYTYQVQALDAAGNRSALTAGIALASASSPTSAPTAPAVPQLGVESATATAVKISWTLPAGGSDVVEYRIYRNNAFVTSTTAQSFTDTNVRAATTYEYAIVAVDARGNSALSNIVTATTPASGKKRTARS
jgi:parallel beta-helix repeat protein